MKEINIFCFGFGQVAKNFIKKLSIEKYNINLSTTSRSESSKETFKGINYNSYLFNSEKFDKKVNPETVVWQIHETDYWITYLKNLVQEHYKETNSEFSKKIIENFNKEISNFIQVCPKEMIDKLKNPISLKSIIKEVG